MTMNASAVNPFYQADSYGDSRRKSVAPVIEAYAVDWPDQPLVPSVLVAFALFVSSVEARHVEISYLALRDSTEG